MSLLVPDLVDPVAVDEFLSDRLTSAITPTALSEAEALADEGLSFSAPPAGAHALRARLAELDGDLVAMAEHARAALAIDPAFDPALDDEAYLRFLSTGAGRKASAARRAELLFHKADRWSGRVPQLDATRALVARVLPEPLLEHPAAVAVASLWQFLGFLLFEAGELDRFASTCGPLLSRVERDLLASWEQVRHRLVRLDEQRRGRARITDLVTGEGVEVTVLHEPGVWRSGRIGLPLLLPAGGRPVLVGEPVLVDDDTAGALRDALGAADPLCVAELCLVSVLTAKVEQQIAEQDERLQFLAPGADPATFDFSEERLLEHCRRAEPLLAASADDGDVDAEARLLLDAIVAERILTTRVPHTWELVQRLQAQGLARAEVLDAVRQATALDLLARAQGRTA
jgi:hypothetical protein